MRARDCSAHYEHFNGEQSASSPTHDVYNALPCTNSSSVVVLSENTVVLTRHVSFKSLMKH
jgi:hypothetical protein